MSSTLMQSFQQSGIWAPKNSKGTSCAHCFGPAQKDCIGRKTLVQAKLPLPRPQKEHSTQKKSRTKEKSHREAEVHKRKNNDLLF